MTKIVAGQIWQDRLINRKVKVCVADPDIVSLEVLDGEGERFIRYHVGNFRAMFYLLPDNVEIRYRKPGAIAWKRRLVERSNEAESRALLKDAGMEVK